MWGMECGEVPLPRVQAPTRSTQSNREIFVATFGHASEHRGSGMILGHYPHDHSGEAEGNDRGGPGRRRGLPMHGATVWANFCE
jgi:hypothetical protein